MQCPRIVISGLAGSSGKTLLSLGLCRAFTQRKLKVLPAKKGPDYIDAAWLTQAAGVQAVNLDPYFLNKEKMLARFCHTWQRANAHLAIIEGNRGIFDGRDLEGTCSTAQIAAWLEAPVILVVNCAKMTRTAAALVAGVAAFEPGLRLAGIILNNTGSIRHIEAIRRPLEKYTNIPVLGALPRLRDNPLPERHLGLAGGFEKNEKLLDMLGDYIAKNLDLDQIHTIARNTPALKTTVPLQDKSIAPPTSFSRPHIGYVRDAALWFYYPENLEALQDAGAELVELSLLDPTPWPELDGLYLGGGFPELYPKELSISPHLPEIRKLAATGRPIYAECGGFMFLCQTLYVDEHAWPMAGLLPANSRFYRIPQSLGYIEATTILENPFHPLGSIWRGHEFTYSRWEPTPGNENQAFALRLNPGRGMSQKDGQEGGHDGLCVGNTFASYAHLYAPVVPHWAQNFVALARQGQADL